MDFEKFTDRAKGFVQSAQSLALREGHQQFSTEHLLKVLLDDSVRLAEALGKADSGVRLEIWPQMFHVWQHFFPAIPEGRAALEGIGFDAQPTRRRHRQQRRA